MGGRTKRSGSLSAWTLQVILTFMKVLRFFGDRQCVISLACIRILCVCFFAFVWFPSDWSSLPSERLEEEQDREYGDWKERLREREEGGRQRNRQESPDREVKQTFLFLSTIVHFLHICSTNASSAFGACSHISSFPRRSSGGINHFLKLWAKAITTQWTR